MRRTLRMLKKYLRRILKLDLCGFTELNIFGEPATSGKRYFDKRTEIR